MTFPPADICSKGTAALMKFLCDESGMEYIPPSRQVLPLLPLNQGQGCDIADGEVTKASRSYDSLAAAAMQYENLKVRTAPWLIVFHGIGEKCLNLGGETKGAGPTATSLTGFARPDGHFGLRFDTEQNSLIGSDCPGNGTVALTSDSP